MKVKIYKPVMAAFALCLFAVTMCSAQTAPVQSTQPVQAPEPTQPTEPPQPTQPVEATVSRDEVSVRVDGKWLSSQVDNLKNVIASASGDVSDALRDANITARIPHIGRKRSNTQNYSQSGSEDIQDNNSNKTYSKTYPANSNDKLIIENSYGNVIVNTWDKNVFKVDVQISASARNAGDEKDMLDDVNISDAKNGNDVAFRTDIDKGKSIWKTIFGDGNNHHTLTINYTVYMPAHNELVMRNTYGNIDLGELTGRVTIECTYGSLHAKGITGESAIRLRYGNIDVYKMGNTAIELSNGNLSLGTINRIQANATYSGININKLRESGEFNIRYGGGLKIEDMDRGVNRLAVNSTYSSVNVGLSGDENANFEIVVHYGDFNYHDQNVTMTEKSPGDNDRGPHTTKSYKGYIGKNGSGKSIAINANYGSVQFD